MQRLVGVQFSPSGGRQPSESSNRTSQHRSKPARFAAFAVTVQNGTFRLAADGGQLALWEEMTSFPFGERDDLLDAAATGAAHLLSARREPRLWL